MKDLIVMEGKKRFFDYFNCKVILYLLIGVFKCVDKWINFDYKMRICFVVVEWFFLNIE